ncbi:MAG: polysaccharide biosynthesis/export family protein [Planctomycetaceae bacterium]|nr:polysaccharide biosynthesis/export family protein [Planctomycetaceae bacterium]
MRLCFGLLIGAILGQSEGVFGQESVGRAPARFGSAASVQPRTADQRGTPFFAGSGSMDRGDRGIGNRPFGFGVGSSSQGSIAETGSAMQRIRLIDYQTESWEHSPENCEDCEGGWGMAGAPVDHGMPDRWITGVDGCRVNPNREPRWRDARPIPWESLAYGEYIGPPRTPHLPEYRVLIGDQIDFVFRRKRTLSPDAYRFGIGDVVAISSEQYEALNDTEQTIQLDGTIQVRGIGSVVAANKTVQQLQSEINDKAQNVAGFKINPEVLIKPVNTETKLQDLIKTVDATAGLGGQSRSVNVAPDGTIQLPVINSVPAIGLSLTELSAEANARYAEVVDGLEVTAILTARAPRFVYVMGEVRQPGQIALSGPTTVMQAIAQANGWGNGANLRHIIVMRRDKNWQLIATKVDLSGALWGHRPNPSDDLWLRHSDIILVPKNPGQRVADFVDIYLGRVLYGIFPTQGFSVSFDGVSRL